MCYNIIEGLSYYNHKKRLMFLCVKRFLFFIKQLIIYHPYTELLFNILNINHYLKQSLFLQQKRSAIKHFFLDIIFWMVNNLNFYITFSNFKYIWLKFIVIHFSPLINSQYTHIIIFAKNDKLKHFSLDLQ